MTTAAAIASQPSPVPLLRVKDLKVHFFTRRGVGRAVDGVSLDIRPGETLGLVGESGSGKSVTGLSILRLQPKVSRIVGGEIWFDGEDLLRKSEREMRRYRGARIALVMQDASSALDPVMAIGDQIAEPLRLHARLDGARLREKAIELLRLLRIPDAERRLGSFPHQLSGGTKQRVLSAVALAAGPRLLVADEPTTALDVTIQAAYLELLRDVQRATGLAILFITHDFGIVARMCDRVAVMYAGRIVETGETRTLLSAPAHPYTKALISSVPDVRADPARRLISIPGQPPSIYAVGPGCPFAARCPLVEDRCRTAFPPATEVAAGHVASCWNATA